MWVPSITERKKIVKLKNNTQQENHADDRLEGFSNDDSVWMVGFEDLLKMMTNLAFIPLHPHPH